MQSAPRTTSRQRCKKSDARIASVHSATTSFFAGSPDASTRVVIFHGYTASPDELKKLGESLAEKLGCFVSIPLLPGHGTLVEELEKLSFDDFVTFANREVESHIKPGHKIILIGYSFGGYLSLLASTQQNVSAVVTVRMPYELKFALNLGLASSSMNRGGLWAKKLTTAQRHERHGMFFYTHFPSRTLEIVHEAIMKIENILQHISVPCLHITNEADLANKAKSGEILASKSPNPKNTFVRFPNRRHGAFQHKDQDEIIDVIIDFLKKCM